MSTKVFWGLLGAILVGWIVLFVTVVMGQMETYNAESTKLDRRVKSMRDYAALPEDELPTESLLEKKQNLYDNWERNVEAAQRFYEDREARVVGGIERNQAVWVARYRDEFEALGQRYRTATGLAAEEALPFDRMEEFGEHDLEFYEKAWKVQRFLIGEITDAGGRILEYKYSLSQRDRTELTEERPHPNFEVDEVVIKATLPPERLTRHLSKVLAHPDLNFGLHEFVVGKDPSDLVTDVIREIPEGGSRMDEPQVRFHVVWNVLTWSP